MKKAKECGEFIKLNLKNELFTDSAVSAEEVTSMLAGIHHNIGCVATEMNELAEAVRHFKTFNNIIAQEARLNDK